MPIIGAHVSASGGLHRAFTQAAAIGADAIQIHPSPPQQWGSPKPDDAAVEVFRAAHAAAGHIPFYFHAVYLLNFASDDAGLRRRSESSLASYLRLADRLGISGVIFHTGSHKGAGFEAMLPVMAGHLRAALERSEVTGARLLIENNAGAGGCVGARFDEIRALIDEIADPRVGACFDTCHAFASGYDLRTPADVATTLDTWDRTVGLEHLHVVHSNDSRGALGSNRDRHENIGQGEIGEAGFAALLGDPRLASIPFILEVPGAGHGPDEGEVAALRRLAALPGPIPN